MYFPDRIAALNEMWRVLRTGSQLAIAVWGPFERATAYVLLTEITKRRWGDAVTEVLTAPFVLGDQEKVIYLFKAAGIDEVAVGVHQGTMRFPSIDVFVETEVRRSPLENRIDEESYRRRKQGLSSDNLLSKDVVTAVTRRARLRTRTCSGGFGATVGTGWSGRTSRPWRRFPPSSRSDCLLIGHRYSGRARCCGSSALPRRRSS